MAQGKDSVRKKKCVETLSDERMGGETTKGRGGPYPANFDNSRS